MITILLATYNGGAFLKEQLYSLFAQSVQDFVILVSDDGSSDNTIDIIKYFQKLYPGKITILPRRSPKLKGAMGNFAYLLAKCPATDYIFFSDQDDVWLTTKIELTLKKFRQYEKNGYMGPLLVHTAYNLANKDLKPCKATLASLTNDEKARGSRSLGHLLQQNVVTGCTMAINRALLKLYRPLPEAALMHDWWLALLAASSGKIAFIDRPTIYYRQHGSNSIGGAYHLTPARLWALPQKCQKDLARRAEQAAAFLQQYGDILSDNNKDTLKAFSSLPKCSYKEKLKILNNYHLWSSKFLTNAELLLFLAS